MMRMGIQTVRQLALSAMIITGLLLGGVLSPRAATATTYYVATTGNDTNPGTQAQPFQTIRKGVSVLMAGDTLYLRGGTYVGQHINSDVQTIPSGTSWSNAVTIAAYPGETVVLQAASIYLNSSYNIQFLIFDGLIVDGGGVFIGKTKYIRMQNGEVKNTQNVAGIGGGGSEDSFTEYINLKVHHNGRGSYFDHGFYVANSNGMLIENCEIYDNSSYGIHVYNAGGPRMNNMTIRNNKIYNNGGGGITIGDANDTLVYNNLVYNNYKGMDVNKNVNNTQVYNNTFYNNASSAGIEVSSLSVGAIIKNNIVYQNGSAIIDAGFGTVMSNNLTTDPKFVDPSTTNFRLQSTSPAIDAGVAFSAVPTDYDGTPRSQGAGYDIGAYEYQSRQLPAPTNLRGSVLP